jgi:hypothetical protein
MTARFHFIEIDLIIYFPESGNSGREPGKYGVGYLDRNKICPAKSGRVDLDDVLEKCPNIKNRYPHTIGYFIASRVKYPPQSYKAMREVSNKSEIYRWMKELSL